MTPLPQQQYHGIGKALGPGPHLARKYLRYLLRSKKGKQAPSPPCATLGGGLGLMVGTSQRVREVKRIFQVTHMQPVLPLSPGSVIGSQSSGVAMRTSTSPLVESEADYLPPLFLLHRKLSRHPPSIPGIFLSAKPLRHNAHGLPAVNQ